MERLTQLQALLTDYVATVDDVMRTRKLGDGLFGAPGGPKDHPCHEQLDQAAQAMIAQFAAETLTAAEAAALSERLLTSEDLGHGVPCAQLMLMAVQRYCLPLIPMLTAADAKRLLDAYSRRYPPFNRFPAQTEVIKALKKQAR